MWSFTGCEALPCVTERRRRIHLMTKSRVSCAIKQIMPNWCRCTVSMRGLAQRAEYYTDGILDFSNIIPIPENIAKSDWDIIHDWCFRNWGTSLNAVGTEIINEDTIVFETTWGPPREILIKMSEEHPDVRITATFYLDGEEMNGYSELKNGKLISETWTPIE